MKVVDEKGKLFGKLNIIDLIVIVLIIAAVVVVGVKVLGGQGEETGAATAKLTYTVRVAAQNAELAEQVAEYVDAAAEKKDQLMAGGNMVDAYIVDYWAEPIRYKVLSNNILERYDGEDSEAVGLVDIYFVIEADVTDTMTNLVGTQEVRIGKSHIVKTTHLEFAGGIVTDCTWEPEA